MLERDAKRKYRLELTAAMLAYGIVLVGSIYLAKPMDDGVPRVLLLLSPVIPLMLSIWVIVRHFARMDEFVRLRSLENFAIAGAVTAGVSFTYGFLEGAGFPKLSMFWVWGLMGVTWSVVTAARCLAAR
jgi:hypothetical protein